MGSLVKVFYSPRNVFQRLDESPHWAMPFFTVLIVTVLITAVLVPTVIQPAQMEMFRSGFQGSEEQLKQILRFMSGPRLFVISMGSALITTPLKMLAQAGIFALLLLFLGGEVSFRKVLGVTAYSALISVAGGIVKGGIMLATKSMEAYTSLNLFVPGLDKSSRLFRFFSVIDFFTIWSLLVFGLGLSVVGKVETKKSYVLVFSVWIVLAVLFSFIRLPRGFGG